MAALAAWLVYVDPHGVVNRAFAAFLVARALSVAAPTADNFLPEGSTLAALMERAGGVAYLATLATLLLFVLLYPRPLVRSAGKAALVIGFATLLASATYLLVPCALLCHPDGATRWGPLILPTLPVAMSLAALAMLAARKRASAAQQEALLLAGGILALNALFDGARGIVPLARPLPTVGVVPDVWWLVFNYAPVAAFLLGLGALLVAPSRRLMVGAFLAVGTGAIVGLTTDGELRGFDIFVLGLWRIAIPLVVTYGIVRHQLFGLDVRLRVGISRGTMVAAFVIVFTTVSEIAQNYVQGTFGYLAGGVAAGALLFALRPMERFADRVAKAALPEAAPDPEAAYQTALEMALADGALTRAEERSLATLASQLGISADRAFTLREVIEDGLSTARGPA